jgi:hypothetical protein
MLSKTAIQLVGQSFNIDIIRGHNYSFGGMLQSLRNSIYIQSICVTGIVYQRMVGISKSLDIKFSSCNHSLN